MTLEIMQWLNAAEQWLEEDYVLQMLEQYRALGPLPGILLPLIESMIPILPLWVFVTANAMVYGLWFGFLYSWIGEVLGSLIVFFFIRKVSNVRFIQALTERPKIQSMLRWVRERGFGMLFIFLSFPFTPSALVNFVAGLSNMNPRVFLIAVVLGKMVMIFIISTIGHNIFSLIREPLKLLGVTFLIFVLWLGGKWLERYLKRTA